MYKIAQSLLMWNLFWDLNKISRCIFTLVKKCLQLYNIQFQIDSVFINKSSIKINMKKDKVSNTVL